ncbi:MAG: hypothetical protein A2020_12300 [Lentisphaerae bacterium GWF2_45_14]|nr:MAG: hypothetical protein A2020_12300 [Lentisphaerae bacterium GWF2_45_14]
MDNNDKLGMKFDAGKPKWSLVIQRFLTGLVRALEHGAAKYAPHSWQTVPNAPERYFSALKRHYDDLQRNDGTIDLNAIDKDSGLPCTNLILANAYFLEGLRVTEKPKSFMFILSEGEIIKGDPLTAKGKWIDPLYNEIIK